MTDLDKMALLPCPFCGNPDVQLVTLPDADGDALHAVGCPKCGCNGAPHIAAMDDPRPAAVAAWNKRAALLTAPPGWKLVPDMYQVRPRSFPAGEGWREVSKREFDNYGDFPGYPEVEWERRKLYAAPQPSPAIDLEQIRVLAQGAMDTLTQNKPFPADVATAVGHMRRLLALIDGSKNNNLSHVGDINVVVSSDTIVRRCVGSEVVNKGVAAVWVNRCDRTVPDALRYLANHPRPDGGEQRFNAAHLFQLADEIEHMASAPLYTVPMQPSKGGAAMTGPIIPADQWPEWADRHCWDRDGSGRFYGQWSAQSVWKSDWSWSNIPMPAGHDWRVPVMRPTTEDSSAVAPAIDLGQLRVLAQGAMDTLAQNKTFPADVAAAAGHVRRLLALIDGQGQPFTGEVQPADLLVEGWPTPKGFQLGQPRGIRLTHKPTGMVVECDTECSQHANREKALNMLRAKLQPSKGEGE